MDTIIIPYSGKFLWVLISAFSANLIPQKLTREIRSPRGHVVAAAETQQK